MAAAKAKRSPAEITLVAATKSATPDAVRHILEMGQRDLGESARAAVNTQRAAQIQEWLDQRSNTKLAMVPPSPPPIWHMAGHLQRNKVKPAAAYLPVAFTKCRDSLRLAEEIQTGMERKKSPRPCRFFWKLISQQ